MPELGITHAGCELTQCLAFRLGPPEKHRRLAPEVVPSLLVSFQFLGMAGVVIVLSPRLTAFGDETVEVMQAVGALSALTGAICAALAQIYIRKMVATEQTSAIVFYFSITSASPKAGCSA